MLPGHKARVAARRLAGHVACLGASVARGRFSRAIGNPTGRGVDRRRRNFRPVCRLGAGARGVRRFHRARNGRRGRRKFAGRPLAAGCLSLGRPLSAAADAGVDPRTPTAFRTWRTAGRPNCASADIRRALSLCHAAGARLSARLVGRGAIAASRYRRGRTGATAAFCPTDGGAKTCPGARRAALVRPADGAVESRCRMAGAGSAVLPAVVAR